MWERHSGLWHRGSIAVQQMEGAELVGYSVINGSNYMRDEGEDVQAFDARVWADLGGTVLRCRESDLCL